jgi:transcriptional regulator with XRE-family HTH domain
VTNAEHDLAERIRELRRRQFGARGKADFAQRLGVSAEEYERFERGRIPPGDILVRMCELTGEDLQWLLTGVAARGTVVISGTRTRHQELLTRLAKLLNEQPGLAAPLEAFVDLLVQAETVERGVPRQLPMRAPRDLIPLFEADELPLKLPDLSEPDLRAAFSLAPALADAAVADRVNAELSEPSSDPQVSPPPSRVEVLMLRGAEGSARRYLSSPQVAACFPGLFGVRLRDDAMRPMFAAGDTVLVSVGSGPQVGHPALFRRTDVAEACCRIWLGEDEQAAHVGRLADGEMEHVERSRLCWSLQVLYRLVAA